MQTLDARHAELFLQEGYRMGDWDYVDIGTHRVDKHHTAASGAIFDLKHVKSRQTAGELSNTLRNSPILLRRHPTPGDSLRRCLMKTTAPVADVLDLKAWVGKPNDWQPKARIGHYGVAVNTNLQPNEGIQSISQLCL